MKAARTVSENVGQPRNRLFSECQTAYAKFIFWSLRHFFTSPQATFYALPRGQFGAGLIALAMPATMVRQRA
jgi:hypothetical protein